MDEGSASRPGRSLPPGKTRYPLYRRQGGPQGRSGQVRKISPSPGFDPRTVQPVASRYTEWAILTHATYEAQDHYFICKLSPSHCPSLRRVINNTFPKQDACLTSHSWNMPSINVPRTAIHWTTERRPRLTAKWNSGDHCATCHHGVSEQQCEKSVTVLSLHDCNCQLQYCPCLIVTVSSSNFHDL